MKPLSVWETRSEVTPIKCTWIYGGPFMFKTWTISCIGEVVGYKMDVEDVKVFKYCPYCGKEIEIIFDKE